MKKRETIRGRIVTASVLLAAIIVTFFGCLAFVVTLVIKHEFIDKRLSSSGELWAGGAFNELSNKPLELDFYKGDEIPKHLQHLSPGTHTLNFKGHKSHILIAEDNGERYAVVDDRSDYMSMEAASVVALISSFIAAIIVAVLIGRASASRVILPLTTLAKSVQQGWSPGQLPGLEATDEIGVLARAIEDRNLKLLSALEREKLFTADVSHEMRTPLTIMLGSAEVLSSRLKDMPELQAMAERIRRNAADSAMHVSALLRLAREKEISGHSRVSLRILIQQEIERYKPLLRGKPVTVSFVAPEDVSLDTVPELVSIAVGNLFRNSCQYTEEGFIRVTLLPSSIVIEDTGLGIPAKVRERLFTKFNRGASDFDTGSGIGLSIVKRVISYLGWGIYHDAQTHRGSRFTIIFKSAPSDA